MKKNLGFVLMCIIMGGVLVGCQKKEETLIPSDPLFGYWENNNLHGAYMRFMNEQEDTRDGDYLFGYEWDTNEDVQENDMLSDYHGNGWFKYKMTAMKKDTIWYQCILMSNKGAEYENRYEVKVLTSSQFVYTRENVTYSFRKTSQPK